MKKMCKKFAIVLAAALFVCGIANVNPATADAKAGLNKKKLSLYVGIHISLRLREPKRKLSGLQPKRKSHQLQKRAL